MKLNKLAAAVGLFLSLAVAAPAVAMARHGADDRTSHVRAARGDDDRAGHVRGGHGADDGPGLVRGGHGADDGHGHD